MSTPRRVLVTGMSGTGTSAVPAELVRRGHRVEDTDAPGWIVPLDSPAGPEPVSDLERVGSLAAPGSPATSRR